MATLQQDGDKCIKMILILLGIVTTVTAEQLYLPPNSPEILATRFYPGLRSADGRAAILRLAAETTDHGYHFNYETENGIQQSETAQESDGIQAEGGYSYTGNDGQVYSIFYTAGANGFQARGAHIPTEPPIPLEILAALAQNARDEQNGIFDDGSYKPDGSYFQISQPEAEIISARTYSEERAAQQNLLVAQQHAYAQKRRFRV